MHKKIIKIGLILVLIITLTGCTKFLKDNENKPVINELTGQRLTENILCQPVQKDVIKLYKKSDYKINELPQCDDMKILDGGYEGIWTTIFVKPLAWIIIQLGTFVKNYGLAIIIITLLIRIILLPITKKTALQSENMKAAKPELDKLEKKYRGKNDQQHNQQKAQDMMMIYKKYKISPVSGCLFAIIQIPLFFAFYESLNRLPAVFEETFIGFQLGTSPWIGISGGHYQYLIIVILVIGATYLSFKLNGASTGTAEQEKQMKLMMNMMTIFISIASFTISTGIAIYWIVNSTFTIIQNLIVKRRKKNAESL
ncbi:MAG: YidC/Oxa1 family membrane protein insertase [Bacilli bacterium]